MIDESAPEDQGRETSEDPAGDMMIRLRGRTDSFRCTCGCNVFRRVAAADRLLYRCNGCSAKWEGER